MDSKTSASSSGVRPVASTDEAVVRFNGTGGQMQNSANGPYVLDSGAIGIASPNTGIAWLEIEGAGQSAMFTRLAGAGSGAVFTGRKANVGLTAVGPHDELFNYNYQAYDGAAYLNASRFAAKMDGLVSSGNVPQKMEWYTGSTGRSLRMTINSLGNTAIGTHYPSYFLDVNGSTIIADDTSVGAEKVTNGTFTGNANGWTLGTGWSYASNTIRKSADGTGTLSQNVGAVVGEFYAVTFTVSSWTVGEFTPTLGGASGKPMSGNGTWTIHLLATTTGDLIFTPTDTSRFFLDNISVKKITSGGLAMAGDFYHGGTNIGFFGITPTTRQTELTDELTTVTFTAPGTPDYAIQDLTNVAGYGFVTKDEGNTVLSVIANLQTRVNELETKLTAYGLLQDAD